MRPALAYAAMTRTEAQRRIRISSEAAVLISEPVNDILQRPLATSSRNSRRAGRQFHGALQFAIRVAIVDEGRKIARSGIRRRESLHKPAEDRS